MNETYVWPDIGAARGIARLSAEQARQAAREEGFAAGRAEGLEAGAAELEAERQRLRDSLGEVLDTLRVASERVDHELVNGIACTAREICSRVLQHELTTSDHVFEHVLNRALARLAAELDRAEILLNPQDYDLLQERYAGAITLHSDEAVPAGGMSVRTPSRSVDYDPLRLVSELFEEAQDAAGTD